MDVQPHLLNLSAYINQNLEKDLPLSSLAKRVGLSPFHFHRKFGAYFGESLHQHIKRLRLERAAYALMHGSTPVRQIARDSGYKTVSAFSHAFSGFAGQSPTRYRSHALSKRDAPAATIEAAEPSWVGELPSISFAFLRAKEEGSGTRSAIREAIARITSLVGPLLPASPEGDPPDADDDRFAFIVATSDLYGVTVNGDFRLDVGLEAGRVAADRVGALGKQALPGGLYARFDFTCTAEEVLERCRSTATTGMKSSKRTPRLSQYFLRFDGLDREDGDTRTPRDYRFFIPLAE